MTLNSIQIKIIATSGVRDIQYIKVQQHTSHTRGEPTLRGLSTRNYPARYSVKTQDTNREQHAYLGSQDSSPLVKLYLDELSESRRVVVLEGDGVPEAFQQRVAA